MARPNWKAIAESLAERLSAHADCEEHFASKPVAECPWCADRAAYLAYLNAGGPDYRPPMGDGEDLTIAELIKRWQAQVEEATDE